MKRSFFEHGVGDDQVDKITNSTCTKVLTNSKSAPRKKQNSRPVYLGPGYGFASSPYKQKRLRSFLKTDSELENSIDNTPSNSLFSDNNKKILHRPSSEKDSRASSSKNSEPTLTALHMLDILKNLSEKKKNLSGELLNPYFKESSNPPLFSARSLEQNLKFIQEIPKILGKVDKTPERIPQTILDTPVEISPPEKEQLTALDIINGRLPSDL